MNETVVLSSRFIRWILTYGFAFIVHNNREPALSLGVAFQLTNILRDVGEDAVQRGRVYLPQEDLRRFGVTEDQIFEQRVDENGKPIEMLPCKVVRCRVFIEPLFRKKDEEAPHGFPLTIPRFGLQQLLIQLIR